MTIAIDAGDMDALRTRLSDAAADVDRVVPTMPGGAAFGPAILGSAVASFEATMRQNAHALRDRWDALDTGVKETLTDMNEVEEKIVSKLDRLQGGVS